jgi:small subunit ribosomal protein S3Ae
MVKKTKKTKKWFTIKAPEAFGSNVIGDTLADSPEKLIGRKIETTLGELTSDPSKQNTKLAFQVTKVDGDVAQTSYLGHRITRDYARSFVKRHTSHLDIVTEVKTSDGARVSVTSSCFTVKKTKTPQSKAIRKVAREVVLGRAQSLTLSQYTQEIVLGKLAADIYKEVKQIYPLRRVEVLKMKVL